MKKLAIVFAVLAFIGISQSQAQSFKIGVGGGLTLVQSPDYFDDYDMSTGYHFGAKAKLGLPLLPIKITGQIYYNTFSGSVEEYEGPDLVNVDYSSSMLIVGAGVEYSLIPGPISPYLGADLFLTSFGDLEAETLGQTFTRNSAESRVGLGLGAGLDFKLLPMFDIDIAAKYNFYNLMGQEDEEEAFNAVSLTANFMIGF
ncbi:MAG TPA: outer membrane beta-barrel protein [Ignavibacteriales bacterium]|nr:outer membrane beta-barrel protein [Ignavibacteriales bacterium]